MDLNNYGINKPSQLGNSRSCHRQRFYLGAVTRNCFLFIGGIARNDNENFPPCPGVDYWQINSADPIRYFNLFFRGICASCNIMGHSLSISLQKIIFSYMNFIDNRSIVRSRVVLIIDKYPNTCFRLLKAIIIIIIPTVV